MKPQIMAADEMYLENLEEYVTDENKIVTYKWLSKTLSVHVNEAKKMLYDFVHFQRNKKDNDQLQMTYLVSGVREENGHKVHKFFITPEENLESMKLTLNPLRSCHIYSVHKAKLKDSNALYTTDYENNKLKLAATASYSSIRNTLAKARNLENFQKHERSTTSQNEQIPAAKKESLFPTNNKKSSSTQKCGGIAGMFAKAPVKSKSPENTAPSNSEKNMASASNKRSVTSFFSKQANGKSKTEDVTEEPKAKKQSPKKGKEPVKKGGQKKKAVSDEDNEDPVPQSKKRRRIQEEIWNSSSEDEEMPESRHAASPEPSDDEPIPATPPPAKKSPKKSSIQYTNSGGDNNENGEDSSQRKTHRIRRRRQVDKTYMDDQGYMVTEKVWESESASEVEEPVKKAPQVTQKPTAHEKKTNNATAKAANKQKSIMNFFGKK